MPDHHEYCTGDFSPDDIVISGISGRFPQCNNIEQLKEALLAKKHIIFQTNTRHEKGAEDLPFGSAGTVSDADKFDSEYFGYPTKSVDATDPTHRMILEVSYEAIADAGYDPSTELKGANIGVYTAISNDDSKEIVLQQAATSSTFGPGYLRAMGANRCSHHFNFVGPSFTMDSACSSSFVALWSAYNDIREGRVEAALVNAGQLCLSPLVTRIYINCGIISMSCESNPFDARANGIVRTEAITAFFVQKASSARRAYATIVHMKHAAGGHVPEGLYVPSYKEEVRLYSEMLKDTGLNPNQFQFIEAHGTGTQVGDPIEVRALETVYNHGREEPLYIGSVKSNVGHAEAPAGHTGAIKAILAFETGLIAPNYGFESANPNCEALIKGTVKVVTEPLPFTAEYIPVNSYGFGGSIVQAILKKNSIEYPTIREAEGLPRLVLYPATTEAAIRYMFDYIESHPELAPEFFALLNKLSFTSPGMKPFRGYALFQSEKPVVNIQNAAREKKREVWFVVTGMGCQWPGMGLEMMRIKVFADSMRKSAAVLQSLGLDLFELLRKDTKHLLTNRSITPAFVTIVSIQIALVDLLRALEIKPDAIIGHSTGELVCAYADGCCNAEQTILSAYWRGKTVEAANLEHGLMAAIGLTYEEAVKRCPKDVYAACHNAEDSVTISGLTEPLEKFVAELQKENVFARVVNAYGYAFHCQHVWPAAIELRKVLKGIIRDPKPRSKRWISTSYVENDWNLEDCRMAGPEYFVHNLMSTVRFSDALKRIPHDALTIEIGPHFLLQAILKRSIGLDARYIGLMKRNDDNNIGFFLESVGKLYVEGMNPKIENLYKPVKFPVPRGTPRICDLIQWNHSHSFYVPKWQYMSSAHTHEFSIETTDRYLLDHFIDGRSLFPATGYVWLAWQALARKIQKNMDDINVVIQDFKIHKATILSNTNVKFHATIFECSGRFEITDGHALVASGIVYEEDEVEFSEDPPTINKDTYVSVPGEDIYNELRIQGYEYGPAFRRLLETSFDGKEGFVEWKDNWITFMDALLLFYMSSKERSGSSFVLPTGALCFKICPKDLKRGADKSIEDGLPGLPVNFHTDSGTCRTVGLEIQRLELDTAPQPIKTDDCVFEEYKFVPYVHNYIDKNKDGSLEQYMIACNQIIDLIQNRLKTNLRHRMFDMEQKIDFDVQSYINDACNEKKLLMSLKEIESIEEPKDLLQGSKMVFSRFVEDIGKDVLNTLLVDDYCLRYMFDVISENTFRKLSVLEINNNFSTILPAVTDVVEKYSMLKFKNKNLVCRDIEKVDKNQINDCNINLSAYEDLTSVVQEKSQSVVIGAICVNTKNEAQQHLRQLSSFVEEWGFILLFHKSRILPPENLLASLSGETIHIVPESIIENLFQEEDLVIVSKISDKVSGNLYLLRRRVAQSESRKIIQESESSTWLDELKTSVSNGSETSWFVSENSPNSGVVGMINCLRHEPGGDKIRCVYIPNRDEAGGPPSFSFEDPFYKGVLDKDLVMNVYKDGCWGTFRHVRLEKELEKVEVDNSYVNIRRYGDLSSLVWMESALSYMDIPDKNYVHIYYSALNFRDVMLATGKISAETAKAASESDNCVLGLEFAGRNKFGERVAGICRSRGLGTAAHLVKSYSITVSDQWSLEEAATVPVVYATCYYALLMRAGLKPGESILIHSGTGGIGLAALNICLSMNCEVFTTVGTERKRKYLLQHFPQLQKENIGCSRDTSFETMVMRRTKGKGVKVVLNSLAGEKFHASIRCVAVNGRFVEIGKYDLAMDTKIGLKFFLNNITFHAVFLDQLLMDDGDKIMGTVIRLVEEGMRQGVVKPLDRTVFKRDEAERAFRFMAGGTHIGKVLVKIREEEKEKFVIPTQLRIPAIPVTYFYCQKVYIVVGGLGGFGIEVSNWLLQKGAKNLVLTTRYGARTPYHHFCLKRWKDEGYNVKVSTRNVSIKEEASKLLREASEIGPVGGIFNSAVVLHDAFLENTNFQKFKEVCAPKADATKYLDVLSRCLCPELDHFVCFSSISCGRGNAGQMNYGYANSVMERICEQRRADGFPGVAIQWGIIGEVGVVHRHMGDDAMIAGVTAQRVKSCLNILDVSLQMQRPVVCSYVIKDSTTKMGNIGDPLQQLARIFGFKDASEFNAVRSFGEMGLDSMMGIEVKHLLESICDCTFTTKEIQEMKADDVRALLEKVETEKRKNLSTALVSTTSVNLPRSSIHPKAVERLNNVEIGIPVFILDFDCEDIAQLRNLSAEMKHPAYGLLLSRETPATDVVSLASWYLEKILDITKTEAHLVANSTASVIALEMVLQNQKSGKLSLTLTAVNGHSYLLKVANKEAKSSDVDILCEFVENYVPSAKIRLKEQLSELTSFDKQVRAVVDLFTKCSTEAVNKTEMSDIVISNVKKLQLIEEYAPTQKLSKDFLIVEDSTKLLANDIAEVKTLLTEICSGKITIQRVPDILSFNKENAQRIVSALNFTV